MATTSAHNSHTHFNIPLDVDYTPIAIHLCMAVCADLPLDLTYAVWAEPKGMGLCTVAPFCC